MRTRSQSRRWGRTKWAGLEAGKCHLPHQIQAVGRRLHRGASWVLSCARDQYRTRPKSSRIRTGTFSLPCRMTETLFCLNCLFWLDNTAQQPKCYWRLVKPSLYWLMCPCTSGTHWSSTLQETTVIAKIPCLRIFPTNHSFPTHSHRQMLPGMCFWRQASKSNQIKCYNRRTDECFWRIMRIILRNFITGQCGRPDKQMWECKMVREKRRPPWAEGLFEEARQYSVRIL